MEPESSSPYPQVTAIRPYFEPTPSSPHDPLQLPTSHTAHSKICSCIFKIKIILYRVYIQAATKKEFVTNILDKIPKHLADKMMLQVWIKVCVCVCPVLEFINFMFSKKYFYVLRKICKMNVRNFVY